MGRMIYIDCDKSSFIDNLSLSALWIALIDKFGSEIYGLTIDDYQQVEAQDDWKKIKKKKHNGRETNRICE